MAPSVRVRFCCVTDVGRERSGNEDGLVIADARTNEDLVEYGAGVGTSVGRSLLLAVADGMGGELAGEVASQLSLQSVRQALASQLAPGKDPAVALAAAIGYANDVVTTSSTKPEYKGMGATLVAVVIEQAKAFIAAVGDSRVYVLRGKELSQVTHDQSLVQLLVDAKSLAPEQAAHFPQRNIILQAIGRAPALSFPLLRLSLRRNDLLILCSDGLTTELVDDEIRDILLQAAPLDVTCRKLVESANARGGHDNITVVLAALDGDGLSDATDTVAQTLTTVMRPPGRTSA